MVGQEEDRVVHHLGSGQDRVRYVCHADRRIAAIAPSLEAAGQRTDPFDAAASQDQRHPGAGGLVGSGAVENDVPVARDLLLARFQFLDHQVERARDDRRLALELHPVANVHHHDVLPAIELGL
jgi:hypothetical protein